MNALRILRLCGFLEGLSFLILLLIAMPLKYLFALPLAVRIVGSIHGLLFLLFLAALFRVATEQSWRPRRYLIAFLASLVPAGTFFLDPVLKRDLEELARSRPAGD